MRLSPTLKQKIAVQVNFTARSTSGRSCSSVRASILGGRGLVTPVSRRILPGSSLINTVFFVVELIITYFVLYP